MNLFLKNIGRGPADINLFTGGRLKIKPSECLPLNEKYSPELEKFYAQLRPVDIILVKVGQEVSKDDEQKTAEPVVETPVESTVEETEDETEVEETEDAEETVVEETTEPAPAVEGESEEETPVESTVEETGDETEVEETLNIDDLMKNTQKDLIKMATEMGHEVTAQMSKKEICKVILGEE